MFACAREPVAVKPISTAILRFKTKGSHTPMAEMSVIWLRVAAAFYSIGLLHTILTLVRRREHLIRFALGAFALGTVFHFVSIIEEGIINNRCPIANFFETLSMCAFLVAIAYLGMHLRYK